MTKPLNACFLLAVVMLQHTDISCQTMNYSTINGALIQTSCSLAATYPEVQKHIVEQLKSGEVKVIKISVSITDSNGEVNVLYPETVYRPNQLLLVTSETGKSMLLLKEYFDALSLQTLGYGVKVANMSVTSLSSDCLKTNTIERSLRNYILFGFNGTYEIPSNTEVCNSHIASYGSGRNVFYICCKMTLREGIQCSEVRESIWLESLFITITILQVVVILFCPLLVPESMYKLSHTYATFLFNADMDNCLKLNVRIVSDDANLDKDFVVTKQHNFVHLSKFKDYIRRLQLDKTYTLYIKSVEISVLEDAIIPEGFSPVTFVNFIKTFFFQCHLRNEIQSVGECCMADICKCLPFKVKIPWYRCLVKLMMLIGVSVLSVPWLVRVWFYYTYEESVLTYQKAMLGKQDLSLAYVGSFVTYLSPTHYIFLAVYVLLPTEIVVYSFLTESSKYKLKFTVRQCFRDMRSTSTFDACAFFALFILYPIKRYGLVGCLLLPMWILVLPFYLLYWALKALPILNLSLRLLLNFFVYVVKVIKPTCKPRVSYHNRECFNLFDKIAKAIIENQEESNSRLNKIIHAFANVLSFITIWAVLLLVIECVYFYVECAVYSLIGFIINPNNTLKYVSLILLVGVYGYECFKGVHLKYSDYSQEVNTEVQKLVENKLKQEALKTENMQVNTAFEIVGSIKPRNEHMQLVVGSEGYLKWSARRLALFLEHSDIPKIPINFLYAMAQLPHEHCPGHAYKLYLTALVEFSLILLFLAFVFIVIFAFGQANDISSAGQSVAALGSGFLPLIFKKVLFKPQGTTSNRNLKWQTLFYNAIDKYASKWIVKDIVPINVEELSLVEQTIPHPTELTSDHVEVELESCETVHLSDVTSKKDYSLNTSNVEDEGGQGVLDVIVYCKDSDIVDIYVPKMPEDSDLKEEYDI